MKVQNIVIVFFPRALGNVDGSRISRNSNTTVVNNLHKLCD